MNDCTHYFKEAVLLDGRRYQHVVGLNEVWDWRLILDLASDPKWQLVTMKKPIVCRFPGEKKRFRRAKKLRCPRCGARMRELEEDRPERVSSLVLLPPSLRSLEPWHDEECRCENCGCRVGVCRPSLPALMPPKTRERVPRFLRRFLSA